jgi:hypothetical protein
MIHCEECNNKEVVCYCGFKEVTKENYDRAFRECKDLKYYCKNHLPEIKKKLEPILTILQTTKLPDEFVQLIESDLNKMTEVLPDYLERKYEEITKNRNYAHQFEFLIGWCIGTCETSYCQTYLHDYKQIPSEIQISEIRKVISRKRILIEKAILEFLEKNDES